MFLALELLNRVLRQVYLTQEKEGSTFLRITFFAKSVIIFFKILSGNFLYVFHKTSPEMLHYNSSKSYPQLIQSLDFWIDRRIEYSKYLRIYKQNSLELFHSGRISSTFVTKPFQEFSSTCFLPVLKPDRICLRIPPRIFGKYLLIQKKFKGNLLSFVYFVPNNHFRRISII